MLGLFAILVGAITGGIFNMDMRGAESTPLKSSGPSCTGGGSACSRWRRSSQRPWAES